MATINTIKPIYTHEGGRAKKINPEQQLRRSVMACMLWEKTFYEDGVSVAERIEEYVSNVRSDIVANIAHSARTEYKLRHVPLLLARALARKGDPVAPLLYDIIQRPDELTEFLAIYWKDGKQPLSAQVKKGLAQAFTKFDEYQLAKYNRDTDIKLRDVLFLCHAKPKDSEQAGVWKRLIDGNLKTPDTWEVSLSSGGDKKEHWTRLLKEQKLGAMALLRNLRNMESAGVDRGIIKTALLGTNTDRVLPFRFIAAAKHARWMEPEIEVAMLNGLKYHEKMPGKTVLLIDVSGSMSWELSSKSDMNRMDAACGLAILAREVCEDVEVFTFSNNLVSVPPRRGFALRDAIISSQPNIGTRLGDAIRGVVSNVSHDRLIVFTDEQSHDRVPDHGAKGYVINVATYENGVGYGKWLHIDGFSEAVINYIQEYEKSQRA